VRDCVSDIKRRLKELLQREAKARGGILYTTITFFQSPRRLIRVPALVFSPLNYILNNWKSYAY
jgi:hypothetical protein